MCKHGIALYWNYDSFTFVRVQPGNYEISASHSRWKISDVSCNGGQVRLMYSTIEGDSSSG